MNNEIKKRISQWIVDTLDNTSAKNFEHNIGVVDGMERIVNYLLSGNTENDDAIKAAYSRLDKRLYPKQ